MEDKEIRKKQQAMHKNYFDNVKLAIDNGFYLESIFLEYSAIEGRLEIILGVLGFPCNKNALPEMKQKVKISQRVKCIKKSYNKHNLWEGSKISRENVKDLEAWLNLRNGYTHGLYKDVFKYYDRCTDAKDIAEKGYNLSKVLYEEAKRLRRLNKNGMLEFQSVCFNKKCILSNKEENK